MQAALSITLSVKINLSYTWYMIKYAKSTGFQMFPCTKHVVRGTLPRARTFLAKQMYRLGR